MPSTQTRLPSTLAAFHEAQEAHPDGCLLYEVSTSCAALGIEDIAWTETNQHRPGEIGVWMWDERSNEVFAGFFPEATPIESEAL